MGVPGGSLIDGTSFLSVFSAAFGVALGPGGLGTITGADVFAHVYDPKLPFCHWPTSAEPVAVGREQVVSK
jgi:hypothetical protein